MKFWKMSGAGNDFVMVDNRNGELNSVLTADRIASVCQRGLSIGADGLIELRTDSEGSAFRMKYYNSDGGAADMCGNGARCICRFSDMLGVTKRGSEFSFRSDAGLHRGLVTGDSEARIWMTEPVLHYIEQPLQAGDRTFQTGYADTGVPHAVIFTDDLEDGSFEKYASLVRHHNSFSAGANANWVQLNNQNPVMMRTFERGVEGETLACGTGAVAVALIASERFSFVNLPVRIEVRSGLILTVSCDDRGWWLQGQAKVVYQGELFS
ncbi:diaminopimelate epimerase [Candidatus Fermentibacteria bacterium]|nr:MAG: diaminopimelate epimerase [Candidatus Fermentibacteria bacterium]PIE52265.1 MAG: diaminopimelate epimerase [Candidatus Fermentibacteria bacterium]PIE52760.1 MAG: diaminopimelate epimerase [Candidatus Fermentibacteria bacterium]